MEIFFDESGFTGRALLDPAQPFFSVASTHVGPEAASAVLRTSFPTFGGREFKFQALWRRPGNRAGFLKLAEQLGSDAAGYFTWFVDKRFCVFQKLIDFLIEPELHDAGFDFYADAHAAKFSNFAHDSIILRGSLDLYVRTTDAYYRFSRDPTDESLAELRATLARLRAEVPAEIRWFYRLAHTGAVRFHQHHEIADFWDTSEIQLSCVLSSIVHWRSTTDEPLRILHDESRNFFEQKEMWDALTSDDAPPGLHDGGNGPPVVFPLGITETVAADSRDHPSIQLCDLLAGLVNKVSNPRADEEAYVAELVAAGLDKLVLTGLRPQPDYPSGPPSRLQGPDMVDRLWDVIRPRG